MTTHTSKLIAVFAIGLAALSGCKQETLTPDGGSATGPGDSSPRPKVAYVTNGVASFWVIAESGVRQGGQEFGADVEVLMPAEGISDQKRMIEDLLTKGADGIAVSPIDPENQTELLNMAAKHTNLITHDSDAPDSDRLCYIGMDNYLAGRMCGDLVVEAMPDGGKIAIFIGRLEQDNARRRRQGVIDAVLGRSEDATRFDPPDAELKEGKWHIVGTYTDQFDRAQGKANAEDALSRHPDLNGMVGLFAYNPPLMLEALKQAEKLNEVKVIAFDEADETLQGIQAGTVYGTVVQNPFEYGRQSVKVLTGLAGGKSLADLGIPENGFLNIPARQIRKDNVDAFWTELKKNLGDTSGDPAKESEFSDAPETATEPAEEEPAAESEPVEEDPANESEPSEEDSAAESAESEPSAEESSEESVDSEPSSEEDSTSETKTESSEETDTKSAPSAE